MTDEPPAAFGDDRVESVEDGEIVLCAPVSKGWQARTGGTQLRAPHPGTAVGWADRVWEVRSAEPRPDGGWRYRLAPWEEAQTIRVFARYDAPAETARSRARQGAEDGWRKRRLAILLAPLAGLLPGAVQKRMENDFGAPALAMTIASALPLAGIGFLGMFQHILELAGGRIDAPAWLMPPLPIAVYLFAESALRLGSAFAGQEPMGSLPVVVAHAAWAEARGEAERPSAATPVSGADRGRALEDRYEMLEPMLSLLPAPSQRRLQVERGFDAVRWGRLTAGVLLAVGALNALASLGMLAAGRGDFWDALGLALGGFLAVEQIRRFQRLARGEPAGSVLGALIRPMAAPLLQAE